MKFLISNDDGFDAPGLAALFEALRPFGQVTVVAPDRCHSSKGHAVDTKQPIRVTRRRVDPFGEIHIVNSSPADCIRVGLRHILKDVPDFVVAGINPGANLGVDLYYSGTAAAAREAALLGVPAFAVSRYLMLDRPFDWVSLQQHLSRLMATMLDPQFRPPKGHFWNINFRPYLMISIRSRLHLCPTELSLMPSSFLCWRKRMNRNCWAIRPPIGIAANLVCAT